MNDIEFEISNHIGYITVQRIKKKNALDTESRLEIIEKLQSYRNNPNIRVVVLRSRGEYFCSGGDIGQLAEWDFSPEGHKRVLDLWEDLYTEMKTLGKPTVAKVQGDAFGGGVLLMLFTDIVFASESAEFGMPEIDFAFVSTFGPALLPRVMGLRKSTAMLMTGDPISASEAESTGLITKSLPEDNLTAEVESVVTTLAKKDPMTMEALKQSIYTGFEMSPQSSYRYAKEVTLENIRHNPAFERMCRKFIERQ